MKDLRIDFENRTVIMTRKFAVAASDPFSDEFRMLQEVRNAYPKFEVKRHTIKKQPKKECYRGLTYDYMRNYIELHELEPEKMLEELEEMILISKCHSNGYRYPTIKKWFLDNYKEVRMFGVDQVETARNEMIDSENIA